MKYLVLILPVLLFYSCSEQQHKSTEETELKNANIKFNIINHGIGHITNAHTETDTADPTGMERFGSDFIIDTVADTIPARKGIEFGVTYSITASINGVIPLTKVWIFPDTMHIPGRKTTRLIKQESEDFNTALFASYRLDDDYEILKGVWHLRFYYKHHLLYYKTFVLI